MKHQLTLALATSLALLGCKQKAETPAEVTQTPAPTTPSETVEAAKQPAPKALVSGIDTSGFDTAVRAQDDFYDYVNGTWMKDTKIPADKSNYGAFSKLADEAEENLKALILEVSENQQAETGSAAQRIRDFYNTFITEGGSDNAALANLGAEMKAIEEVNNLDDLYRLMGSLGRYGVNFPIGGGIFSDAKDPDTNVVYLGEAGLTLPDRDYYLKDDEQFVKGRELYRQYVTDLLTAAGMADAADKAEALLNLETELARVHWTKEDNRDPNKTYNAKTGAEIEAMAPKVKWNALLEGAGISPREHYVVAQPSYFEAADDIIADTSLETWKDYAAFQTLNAFAPILGKPMFELWFGFNRKGLQGVEEPRPVWKRAVEGIDNSMGELLGQLYVDKHFRPEAKARMNVMIENLVKAYESSINELEWMSDETKQQALVKLSKFRPKIGYPDKWRDYSKMDIASSNLVANMKSAAEFEYNRQLDKLDRPVDKDEWFMTPQTVNAYYNPIWNEIVFPAAILQPPFFNVDADEAVNYGGIGAVIGHEIGHGFDDQGRKFDGDGNLRDWWTEQDNSKFEVLKNKLAAQYDKFEAIDGLTINGQFTSGENIGDLGGLSIAYKAYKMSLNGEEAPIIDGLTGDQRFFMGWAQVWRRLYKDEELKRRLTVDPHSPSKARTNVVLSNIPAFYAAFNIQEGDGMYLPPEERVRIW